MRAPRRHVADTFFVLCVTCSQCVMKSIRKDNPGLGLSPPALYSDGGPLKSSGIPPGCSIIHLRSVTQPAALFHITWALLWGVRTISGSPRHPRTSASLVNTSHSSLHLGLATAILPLLQLIPPRFLLWFYLVTLTLSVWTFYPALHVRER